MKSKVGGQTFGVSHARKAKIRRGKPGGKADFGDWAGGGRGRITVEG